MVAISIDTLGFGMKPLRLIRRMHGPLVCVVIACLVSVGCKSSEQTVLLGKPSQAYRADNGAVLLGYNVQRAAQARLELTVEPSGPPDYVGWHWLVIEPATAKRLLEAVPVGATDPSKRVIAVKYKGWGRNARLTPPLLSPGRADDTPPTVGGGELTELLFNWDSELGGPHLVNSSFAMLPVMLVSPGFAMLRERSLDRELTLRVLKVAAIAGIVVGLVFLGGSTDISIN